MKNYLAIVRTTFAGRIHAFLWDNDWPSFSAPVLNLRSLIFSKVKKYELFGFALLLFLANTGIPPGGLSAQTTCGFDNACLVYNLPVNYKCINGNFTIGQLYTNNNPTGQPILLDPVSAQSTPQFVIVNGTVTFNDSYTFASGSEILFNTGGGFIVNTGKALNLQTTYLHGCQNVWQGITVKYGGNILMNGNTVEDAFTAVLLEVDNSTVPSGISATGNNFRRNRIGIFMSGLSSGLPRIINILSGGIAGNTFDGHDKLSDNTNPFYGIYLYNIKPLTIGAAQGNPNIFQEFDGTYQSQRSGGIYANLTSVNIVNSRFFNIGKNFSSGLNFGIYANYLDDANSLTVKGLGGNSASAATFDHVSCPIRMNRGNLDLRNIRAVDTRIGVYYGDPVLNPSPVNLQVEDCIFEGYLAGGLFFDLQQRLVNNLTVKDCSFTDSAPNIFGLPINGYDRYGVLVSSSQLNPVKALKITDNSFANENKGFSSLYRTGAVFLRNIKGGLIENNDIADNDGANTTIKDFKGIRLEMCTGLTVRDNVVSGSGSAYASTKTSVGIDLFESGMNLVSCNQVDQLRTGIGFSGENCDMTVFSINTMIKHDNGLLLAPDAIIGKQVMRDNRWIGPASLEGNFAFTGFDPSNPDHRLRVGMSKFEINTDNQNTALWANPRIIGNEPDNEFWFAYNAALPPAHFPLVYICPVDFCCGIDNLSEGSQLARAGNFPAYKGFGASTWDAEFRLYGQLDYNPGLRPSGSQEAAWYASKSTANLGRLYAAYEVSVNAGSNPALLDPVVASNNTQQNLLSQLYAKDAQIAQAHSSTEEAQYIAERSTIFGQIESEQANYKQLSAALLTNTQQEATAAATSLSSLSATNTHEQYLKDVLQIQLNLIASGQEISETQQSVLQSIAGHCRYEGGLGVLLARLMLGAQSYDDDALCSGRNRPAGQNQTANAAASVSPNPATNRFVLHIDRPFAEGQAVLRDALGRDLRQLQVNEPDTNISTADLPRGIYFLSVLLDRQVSTIVKVLINR